MIMQSLSLSLHFYSIQDSIQDLESMKLEFIKKNFDSKMHRLQFMHRLLIIGNETRSVEYKITFLNTHSILNVFFFKILLFQEFRKSLFIQQNVQN